MISYLWPIAIVIIANSVYNICAKSTPATIDPFASLTLTYLTAAALSFVLFLISGGKNMIAEMQKTNWTAFVLGIAIVGLEFGFIHVYRAGWKVSTGALVANTGLAIVLLCMGYFLYKESITLKQMIGMAVSIAGILLMSK